MTVVNGITNNTTSPSDFPVFYNVRLPVYNEQEFAVFSQHIRDVYFRSIIKKIKQRSGHIIFNFQRVCKCFCKNSNYEVNPLNQSTKNSLNV
ncbi:unnamed protein product [Tenebrio molitor]|nr:unnamed protein product [Tenebrio molitor]